MKLMIVTDYIENYGDTDTPRWKQKFGSVYVVNNIELDSECKVVDIEEMKALVELDNPVARETVSYWEVLSDGEKLDIEDYELPMVIYHEKVDGRWTGYKVNDTRMADTWLREGILIMEEFWDCKPDGTRENYRQRFTMDDGTILNSQDELSEWYNVVYTKRVAPDLPVL